MAAEVTKSRSVDHWLGAVLVQDQIESARPNSAQEPVRCLAVSKFKRDSRGIEGFDFVPHPLKRAREIEEQRLDGAGTAVVAFLDYAKNAHRAFRPSLRDEAARCENAAA
jgi:hypothetical protein